MGKVTGFLEFQRLEETHQEPEQRKKHYREFILRLTEEEAKVQGARCMDCGTPFCMSGCPVNNIIPDFNDLVYKQDWQHAIETLHSTNNFPEFTGRICPAPCEEACVLRINDDPVGIKSIEHAIIDKAFEEGWVKPQSAAHKTGKKIAVVGSGPAGLACAQQLARAGHDVTVFEKNDRIGGLLRYGIPNFKMEKHLIDRRLQQMEAEGVRFITNAHVGQNIAVEDLRRDYDALLLTGGAEWSRDLKIPGRELKGIHFAMEFLPQQNRRCEGDTVPDEGAILATGKRVEIIGGDLVLLAMGFMGPVRGGMLDQLGVKLDPRGNVAVGEDWMSSVPGVFAAGDMRRGQSLVVWAIAEGRKAARAVDTYLMGESRLQ